MRLQRRTSGLFFVFHFYLFFVFVCRGFEGGGIVLVRPIEFLLGGRGDCTRETDRFFSKSNKKKLKLKIDLMRSVFCNFFIFIF